MLNQIIKQITDMICNSIRKDGVCSAILQSRAGAQDVKYQLSFGGHRKLRKGVKMICKNTEKIYIEINSGLVKWLSR